MKLLKKELFKKHSKHHPDLKLITVRCIQEYDDDTPQAVVDRIIKEEWMHPDSGDNDRKKLVTDIKALWSKAALEIGEQGTAYSKQRRLSGPEQMEQALAYLKEHVVYDVFKKAHIDLSTNKETSAIDLCYKYNKLGDNNSYIPVSMFDRFLESVEIPRINPVKIWAEALPKWDKKDHIKTLCSYVPAEDPELLELFLKAWLIRAYVQAVNPEDKPAVSVVNRFFLMLYGTQEGSGKTGFLEWLSPKPEWVSISGVDLNSKDSKSDMGQYMIIVDDEMRGLQHKELEHYKSLISIPKIDIRLPYARRPVTIDRTASLCGSTNRQDLFSVGEQNTRFLCVTLKPGMFDWKVYIKKIDKEMLWSQVKYLCTTNWLEDNDTNIREARNEINVSFEKESMEHHAVRSHFKTSKEEGGKQAVLTSSDAIILLRSLEQYRTIKLYDVGIGVALKKVFGEKVNGYKVREIVYSNSDGKLTASPPPYDTTKHRTKGYKVVFDPLGVSENAETGTVESTSLVLKVTKVKKAKKRKS